MTSNSRVPSVGRTVSIMVASAILAYLSALLVPLVPVQQFIRCNGFSCPLIFMHDMPVNGGFTRNYLYSTARQLTGFGSYYNIDVGYNLPSGLYFQGGYMTDVGVLVMIIFPLSLAAIACLALAFLYRTGTRTPTSSDIN